MRQEKKSFNPLTVHPPVVSRQLGRYRDTAGVFLIRDQETVIYVGKSKNIYKAILRLFQKGGLLEHLDRRTLKFESVLSNSRLGPIETVLKMTFKPKYNYIAKCKPLTLTFYQKKQEQRIWETYLEQTRFDVPGEHQSDKKY
jgi:excinuclease UvrABC nuclease subunit